MQAKEQTSLYIRSSPFGAHVIFYTHRPRVAGATIVIRIDNDMNCSGYDQFKVPDKGKRV